MWNFNTNVALNVAVNAVLAVILMIIEINCYLEGVWKRIVPHRAFLAWVGSYIIYLYLDVFLDLVKEFNPEIFLINLIAVLKAIASAMIFASAVRWVVSLIAEKEQLAKGFRVAAQITPFLLSLVLCYPILIGTGSYFTVVEGLKYPLSNIKIYYYLLYVYLGCIIIAIIRHSDAFRHSEEEFLAIAAAVTNFIAYQEVWAGTPVNVISTALILILYFRMWNIRKMELLSVEKKLAENELEMNQARLEATIAQIQPHFLYNTLSTASGLCLVDPEKAAEVINGFGKYLRANLESLKTKHPIPISQELDYVKVYLDLEKVRFGNRLGIEYKLESKNFTVPALSVQTLAENAVKHGITETSKPGTVRISTFEGPDYWYVKVEDDGVGFDTEAKIDTTKHFGISNVRARLAAMVGGELIITSEKGKGTSVLIRIPKEEKNHENSCN